MVFVEPGRFFSFQQINLTAQKMRTATFDQTNYSAVAADQTKYSVAAADQTNYSIAAADQTNYSAEDFDKQLVELWAQSASLLVSAASSALSSALQYLAFTSSFPTLLLRS